MKKVLLLVLAVLVAVIVLLELPWIMLAISSIFSKEPPKPKETYGEFPFKLVYEINDKQISVEDVLVIEYVGVGYNEAMGKYNRWKTYYKNAEADPNNPTTDESLKLFTGCVEGDSVTVAYELGSC